MTLRNFHTLVFCNYVNFHFQDTNITIFEKITQLYILFSILDFLGHDIKAKAEG